LIIFVVGSARSGTTLMSRVLGRHSRVYAFRELHFFEELWVPADQARILQGGQALALTSRLMKNQDIGHHIAHDPRAFHQQATAFLETQPERMDPARLYAAYLRHHTEKNQKEIPLTHTPRDLYYVQEILNLFEGARVIWMVRDPRAVLCSQKLRWRRPLWRTKSPSRSEALRAWLNYHPITYGLLWRSAYRASAQFADSPAVRVVSYERLVEDPGGQIASLLQWLGLMPEEGLLEVGRLGSSHHRDQVSEVGIDPEAVTRWRHSCLTRTEVFVCQHLTRREMMHSGYELEPVRPSPLGLVSCLASWLPRSGAAFLLNLRRTRSQRLALRRRLTSRPAPPS
jgi:hypothetical protein